MLCGHDPSLRAFKVLHYPESLRWMSIPHIKARKLRAQQNRTRRPLQRITPYRVTWVSLDAVVPDGNTATRTYLNLKGTTSAYESTTRQSDAFRIKPAMHRNNVLRQRQSLDRFLVENYHRNFGLDHLGQNGTYAHARTARYGMSINRYRVHKLPLLPYFQIQHMHLPNKVLTLYAEGDFQD